MSTGKEKSPRIAVLLHGNAGKADKYNCGSTMPIEHSYNHLKKFLLNINENVDVFMHSWSTELEEDLVNLYKPVDYKFEPQITFDFEYVVGDPDGPGGEINRWVDGKFRGLDNLRFHSMFSRWYSARLVNELKKKHEEENGFKYDFVMLTRYDLAYLIDFYFPTMDNNAVYLVGPDGWNEDHEKGEIMQHGVHDLWMISNSKYIDHVCDNVFDMLRNINHFPGKFTHSHFFLRHFLKKTGLLEVVSFVGPPRPWNVGVKAKVMGPSPPVREWYNLIETTPDSDMAKERKRIQEVSERLVRNTPDGGFEVVKINKDGQ